MLFVIDRECVVTCNVGSPIVTSKSLAPRHRTCKNQSGTRPQEIVSVLSASNALTLEP